MHVCVCMYAQSCLILCNPSLPCPSVHGIFQARILECVDISFSRGSSQPKDQTHGLLCLLHWQVGSLPAEPSGKPTYMHTFCIKFTKFLLIHGSQVKKCCTRIVLMENFLFFLSLFLLSFSFPFFFFSLKQQKCISSPFRSREIWNHDIGRFVYFCRSGS